MRTPLIAGNWKMYKTIAESVATVEALAALVGGVAGREVLVAPVFTALSAVAGAVQAAGLATTLDEAQLGEPIFDVTRS